MDDFNLDTLREHYVHDNNCSQDNFEEANNRGIKRCKDCSGLFDAETGKGVAVTDKRFDSWRHDV